MEDKKYRHPYQSAIDDYHKNVNQKKQTNMKTSEQIEKIAIVCHETNRAYCKTIGDNSQPDWENAPDWQKQSAINGVKYHLENPDAKPEDSHNSYALFIAIVHSLK